ncbi:hypothetical protein [Chroococcidiopsis sp.]|uniref:hypothetical protein n=1 Tax=Chroococcidiopsis sp. TaxID=3088168 RepID=UPI003F347D59
MKIISLSGAIGSGKDTAAQMISELSKQPVHHCKFAHAIQDQISLLCGFYQSDLSHRQLFDDRDWKEGHTLLSFKGIDYTPRGLLKTIGEGYRSLFGAGIWVELLASHVRSLPEDSIVVISDLRFPHELAWVHSMNGTTVYIQNEVAEAAFYNENQIIHASESYLTYLKKTTQIELLNESTLSDLLYFVKTMMLDLSIPIR